MTQKIWKANFRVPAWQNAAVQILVCLGLLLPVAIAPAHAQTQTGISGTVTDSTQAVVRGAKVTITSRSTGVVSSAASSSAGTYTVVGLLPGEYGVAADAAGFRRIETTAVVDIAKITTINLTLTPGAATETVNVKGTETSLDTTSPEVGTTIEPELVSDAPIEISGLARQIDSFSYLVPGVQGSAGSHNINGGVTYENETQFNGIPVAFVQFQGNQTNINPPYEAVDEFRVNSSTFDAQYGLGQGAVTFNMASGTNQLHGDAFEIMRNQLFDSVGFFPTRFSATGKAVPPINQENNYGFTVGGPVIVPRLYHGRNRTFFHFSGDWFRQNHAQTGIGTVPTADMKNGDFSKFVDAEGNLIPIYDPTTGQPFPGNKIDPRRFSALSKILLPLIPDPDRTGMNAGLRSNKSPAITATPIGQFMWDYTLDENLTSSQSIHFSQWRNSMNSPSLTSAPIVPTSNPLQSEETNNTLGSGFVLNYVKTFSNNCQGRSKREPVWRSDREPVVGTV
jgi:hypothetical protein